MLSAIRHRGPDSAQIWAAPNVALGCARLAIIGGESATQPDVEESSVLVFNGEIFNFETLRSSLPAPLAGWRTAGDTEVLHRLLQVEGTAGLQRVEGQFALAWYSIDGQRLVLARDRDGIAPLYLTTTGEGMYFSSEVWSLVGANTDMGFDASIATAVLWGTPPEASAFVGVSQVPAGGVITAYKSGVVEHGSWVVTPATRSDRSPRSVLTSAVDPTIGPNPTAADLADAVRQAVRLRVPRDVPWGLMLSGGLDSAVIASVAVEPENPSAPLAAFGVQFAEAEELDEREYQEVAARALGLELVPVRVNHRVMANEFVDTVRSAGAPLIRLAPVATRVLARHAHAAGVRVLLSGEGADERFRGYSVLRGDAASQPRSARLLATPTRTGIPAGHSARWITTAGKIAALLSSETTGSALFERVYSTYVADWINSLGDMDPAAGGRRARRIEERFFLHSALLASQSDRMLMSYSIEGRFPFLDGEVTRIADSLSEESLVNDQIEKRLLREAFESRLPTAVVWRPKHPYTAPDAAFWRSPQGFTLLTDLVNARSVASIGWFSWPKVQWHLSRIQSGARLSVFDELVTTWMASCAILNERSTDARAA